MQAGVVDHCVNCGCPLSPAKVAADTLPHYCEFCFNVLVGTGQLPSGLLKQTQMDKDGWLDEEEKHWF